MTTKLRFSLAPPIGEINNMTLNLTSGNTTISDDMYYNHVEHIVTCYVFGVLFFIGLTGNVVSFIVLQNEEFSQRSMRFLLSALACVDTGLLVFGLLRQWLWELLSKDPRSFNEVICKIWYFGVYYFGQLSPWTIVLLTLERLLSVCWPVKAKVMFNLRRVVLSWTIIAVCLFALNCHNIWKVSVRNVHNQTMCMHTENWDDFHVYVWLWVDFLVVCALPFILIASFNIATILRLARMKSRRDSLLAGNRSAKHFQVRSTTVMLVVVSAFFLVTTSPLELFFLVSDLENTAYNDLLYAICNFFYYLNSSANFGLYCLSGAVFRRALAATFVRRRDSAIVEGYTLYRGSWMYTGNRRPSVVQSSESFTAKLARRRSSVLLPPESSSDKGTPLIEISSRRKSSVHECSVHSDVKRSGSRVKEKLLKQTPE